MINNILKMPGKNDIYWINTWFKLDDEHHDRTVTLNNLSNAWLNSLETSSVHIIDVYDFFNRTYINSRLMTVDGKHFQCKYLKAYSENILLSDHKEPASKKCDNPVDRRILWQILSKTQN